MNWLETLENIRDGNEPSLLEARRYFHNVSRHLINQYDLVDIDEDDLFQKFFEHIISSKTLDKILYGEFNDPGAILGKALRQVAIDHGRYITAKKRDYRRIENRDPDSLVRTMYNSRISHAEADVELADLLQSTLTSEELQILDMIAEGDRSREVAFMLDTSVSTASRRIVELRCKLQTMLGVLS